MRSGYSTTSLLALAALVLVACEDGVPTNLPGQGVTGAGAVTLATFDGIWTGSYIGNPPGTADQWDSDFIGYMRDGRLVLFESNGQVWDGDYTLESGARARSPDVVVFRPDGRRSTRLIIDASISGDNSLDISYNLGTAVGLIQMQFLRDPSYERSTSLSQLEGIWTLVQGEDSEAPAPPDMVPAITVDGDRAIFDGQTADGCFYQGTIEPFGTNRNLYDVSQFILTDGDEGACDLIVNISETDGEGNVTIVPTPFSFAGDGYTGFATLPTANSMTLVVTNGDDRAVKLEMVR